MNAIEPGSEMPLRKPRASISAFALAELVVLLAVLVVVVAALLLPALARTGRHPQAQKINCVNNLKQAGLSFKTWALDNGDKLPMGLSTNLGGTMEWTSGAHLSPHWQVMSNELSTPLILVCPVEKKRRPATNFNTAVFRDENISYFLNVDANFDKVPCVLAGDGNLTNAADAAGRVVELAPGGTLGWSKRVHKRSGNVLFADGSVLQVRNGGRPTLSNPLPSHGQTAPITNTQPPLSSTNTVRLVLPPSP